MRSKSRLAIGILGIVVGGAIAMFAVTIALSNNRITCVEMAIVAVCLAVFAGGINMVRTSKSRERSEWDEQEW